jgi:hypothetical protein
MAPVTTGQIYWGAVPFVVIQCIMVALVILFPQMVMHYKSSAPVVDQQKALEQFNNIAPPAGVNGLDLAPPKF